MKVNFTTKKRKEVEEAYKILTEPKKPNEFDYECDDYDYDIEGNTTLETANANDSVDSNPKEMKENFGVKRTIAIVASIVVVTVAAVTTIACSSNKKTAPAAIAETTVAGSEIVAEPEVAVEPEVTEQKEVVIEEPETTEVEETTQQEEATDTKNLEDWLSTLEIAPIFVTWNEKTNEKNIVAMDGEYVLDDDTKLILFTDAANVEEMEFLPSGIVENNTIQNKGNYYVVPIMQTGKNNIEASVSYDSSVREFKFSVINNSTKIPEVVETTTQQTGITDEEANKWLDEVAEEYAKSEIAVAIWNTIDGTKQVNVGGLEIKDGDNFAFVFPKEFEIDEYTVDATCTVNIRPEGNIAYLTFEDTHSGERENMRFFFVSKDGNKLNTIYSIIVP